MWKYTNIIRYYITEVSEDLVKLENVLMYVLKSSQVLQFLFALLDYIEEWIRYIY